MSEKLDTLLRLSEATKATKPSIERLCQRLIFELEDPSLVVPIAVALEAFQCLKEHSAIDQSLQKAVTDSIERTGQGDYAVAFNSICDGKLEALYIALPADVTCSRAATDHIKGVGPYGFYYTQRELREMWLSPDVELSHVADVLEAYIGEFKRARSSDEPVAKILDDMLSYGYLDELCQVARASRTRAACRPTSEAKKVVAAEQALVRSMGEAEYALVSYLTENLHEHKTVCLREYNRKEQERLSKIAEAQAVATDEDRDDYGQIMRRRGSHRQVATVLEPDTSDLHVLTKPYWLYCEKGNEHYWVGDRNYHGFVVSYTSEKAQKLRFAHDSTWKKADLGIEHGRLQSFKWHSAVEQFVEVPQNSKASSKPLAHPAKQTPEPQPAVIEARPLNVAAAPPGGEQRPLVPESLVPVQIPVEQVPVASPPVLATHMPEQKNAVGVTPDVTVPIQVTESVASPPPTPEPPRERRVGYTLESIADRLRQEQDTVMRTPPVGVTLITGAAGSGKTNVAFHRLDYLIQELPRQFSSRNIAVFAPKVSLTKYLKELALSLGFWSLPVYSYEDWIHGIVSTFSDANRFLADEDLALGRRKSSAHMVDLMRRYLSDKAYELHEELIHDSRLQDYVDMIDRVFERPPSSLIRVYTMLRDTLFAAVEMRHAPDEVEALALRAHFQESARQILRNGPYGEPVVAELEALLSSTFRQFPGFRKQYALTCSKLDGFRQSPGLLKRLALAFGGASQEIATIESSLAEFLDAMFAEKNLEQWVMRRTKREENRVNARLRSAFKRVCFLGLYAKPPGNMAGLCEIPFLAHVYALLAGFYRSPYCWEYLGLSETPEHRFGVFELSSADVDVAAWLIYMMSSENLAEEPTSRYLHIYDHVLVDEAQDFTPLQLLLLQHLSRNSMTLAGDLTQRIFPTGIYDWSELEETIDFQYSLTMSHRITLETALFANALMENVDSATLAERVAYHGERPLVITCHDESDTMTKAVSYVAAQKRINPAASILLVHPRNAALRDLRDALGTVGITGYVAKGDTWEFSEKVTVTTYRRVQGLEFDYVVVLGLSDFESMEMSGDKHRILYTLATRAKNRLVICAAKPLPALVTGLDSSLYELVPDPAP